MSSEPRRSVLRGGRRRRRAGALLFAVLAVLAVLAPLVALGGAAWLALERDGGSSPAALPFASAGSADAAAADAPLGPEPDAAARLHGGAAAVDLDAVDAFRPDFERWPRSGLVFDLDSGEVIWQRRATMELPVASLTKMMTALLVVERTSPRERVRITKAALDYRGSGVGRLPRGKRVPIEALLHGLLMPSGNDAAKALAIHVAGDEERFVEQMNERARELGLGCTRFVSPHGLEKSNRSCAADLAALARLDMREFRIRRVVRKKNAALRFPIKGGKLHLTTTNPLIRSGYRGAIGLKTGYTTEAGRCLVGVVERGDRTLGVVLIDSPDPGRQARRLLRRSFRVLQ